MTPRVAQARAARRDASELEKGRGFGLLATEEERRRSSLPMAVEQRGAGKGVKDAIAT